MKRSDRAKMTYTKLVDAAYDADAQSLLLANHMVRQMALLADFAVDALAAADGGATYMISAIASQHFPEPKAQPQDEVEEAIEQLRASPPAFGEVPL